VKTTVANTFEAGYWSGTTTRAGAIRMHPNGQVAMTIEDSASAPTDGGATAGSEADGTLARGMFAIQKNGQDVELYYNNAGAIESVALGGQALIWAEENANLTVGSVFSFGNGASGSSNNRICLPKDGAITDLTINTVAATTATIELYINGSATGQTVSLSAATSATISVSQAISAGDTLHFQCTSGSGGSAAVACALYRFRLS